MKALVLKHATFEGPALIADYLTSENIELSSISLFLNEGLPSHDTYDILVIMGGPMSVNDNGIYPWLNTEIRFITESIALNKTIIGICLGAQLIAKCLGAEVFPGNHKEIGWFPVTFYPWQNSKKTIPSPVNVFHWHGETFNLPAGATRIASSQVTPNQGFVVGNKILALQFHMEIEAIHVRQFIENCGDELNEQGGYIQPKDKIINQTAHFQVCKQNLFTLLAEFI